MLLECEEPKFIIINLTEIDQENDSDLKYFLGKYDCAAILSESERRSKLEKQYSSLEFYSLTFTDLFNPTRLFKKILSENNYEPYQTIYITGSYNDVLFAQNICLSTLLISSNLPDLRIMPDFIFSNLKEIIKYFRSENEVKGYFGEIVANNIDGKGRIIISDLENPSFYPGINLPIIVTGRYFSKTDPRSAIHPLSQGLS